MPTTETKNNVSIIQIIQKMVADGEAEQKIVSTLQDLGVNAEQAKRLLLIGQADTFGLLRGEINKIVREDVERQKPEIIAFIQSESEKVGQKTHEKITKQAINDIQQYERAITGQSKSFQEQIQDNIRRVTEL